MSNWLPENDFEPGYLELLRRTIQCGEERPSRAGPVRSIFGTTLTVTDLAEGRFPLLTTRKMYYPPILGELKTFLSGSSRLSDFKKNGCNYWDMNAKDWYRNRGKTTDQMSVGRIYGVQWRDWQGFGGGVDQLKELVDGLITDPFGRRHLVSAWNPSEVADMCLPPCHLLFQCYVRGKTRRLDIQIYQRSVDLCVGLPSDIALYAGLLLVLCASTGYKPGWITFSFGDTHVYENHVVNAKKQLTKMPRVLPKYFVLHKPTIDRFNVEDIILTDYTSEEKINYEFNA